MLVAVIACRNYTSARVALDALRDKRVEAVELRLDYFSEIRLDQVRQLCKLFSGRVILTLRTVSQGGYFTGTKADYLAWMEKLISLEPDYLDVEYGVSRAHIQRLHRLNPRVKLMMSYHHFQEMPQDLDGLLDSMRCPDCHGYKIACQANSIVDTMRMLDFVHRNSSHIKLTGIAMGELGEASRILGPVVGNVFDFAVMDADQVTAPGQMDVNTLLDVYHYAHLNRSTQVYALIGDPVTHSIGHLYHNRCFMEQQRNAVYVKLTVRLEELQPFFELARCLPFYGFSVTMPLKERVLAVGFLDPRLRGDDRTVGKNMFDRVLDGHIESIGAVNTISVDQSGYYVGHNTDGVGVMQAIQRIASIAGKRVIVMGAGGSARAVAYEAVRLGAVVNVVNRTAQKARDIAAALGCVGHGLEYLSQISADDFDILINATSVGMQRDHTALNIPNGLLCSQHVVVDMVYGSSLTNFLQKAKAAGCRVITGQQVFFEQAHLQQDMWR